jgi:hypothetical protein
MAQSILKETLIRPLEVATLVARIAETIQEVVIPQEVETAQDHQAQHLAATYISTIRNIQ